MNIETGKYGLGTLQIYQVLLVPMTSKLLKQLAAIAAY